MADLSDVLNHLATQVAAIVYPNGASRPSLSGIATKIYPGWPVPNVLEADLKAGKAHISVYPLPTERKSTRYIGRTWVPMTVPMHTVVMTVTGSTVALSGSVSLQNLLINLNGISYVYSMTLMDSLATAAAGLATLIPGATSSGPVVTLPAVHALFARVGGFATASMETKRQEKQFQITVWAPTPTTRDLCAGPIDAALSDSMNIAFADGSTGIIRYSHSTQTDQIEKAGLYRRDLIYTVDYATVQTQTIAEVIAPVLNIENAQSGQIIKTLNL
ncbi:hypothetical protein [Pseudomonas sp. CCI2.4]|uniref:hypothetical protein n=1 Tax=Pseudomonas sp. CCI2.4 TaxID=3048617 RepID=UPI002B227779|nr:hypothetical protein [Pseudomonas sp. CCI2.4]MEB0133569.1 hypothetical protein [Pseudomonas sp. CCI2.4]